MFQMQNGKILLSFAVSRTSGRYGELWLNGFQSTLLSVSHIATIHKNIHFDVNGGR